MVGQLRMIAEDVKSVTIKIAAFDSNGQLDWNFCYGSGRSVKLEWLLLIRTFSQGKAIAVDLDG